MCQELMGAIGTSRQLKVPSKVPIPHHPNRSPRPHASNIDPPTGSTGRDYLILTRGPLSGEAAAISRGDGRG